MNDADQAALERAEENLSRFEAWAKREGGLPLERAQAMRSPEHAKFPCTYRNLATEMAWRGWANKPGPSLPTGPVLSEGQVRTLLDGVLRAAGSGLRYYSMEKTLVEMTAALRAVETHVLEALADCPREPATRERKGERHGG